MRVKVEKKIVVITPTIGKPELQQAMWSVQEQTYGNFEHLIVVDGHEYWDKTHEAIYRGDKPFDDGFSSQRALPFSITKAPTNTGKNGFYGHRIYAAYPHLVDADYIAFLDEDNHYEPNHLEMLAEALETDNRLAFAYSLRNVYNENHPIEPDCCESIGIWPIWFTTEEDQKDYLVDTSSYLFKKEFITQACQIWHHGWGGDRRFYNSVRQVPHICTGEHTLNYRLPDMDKAYGGQHDFFQKGAAYMKAKYGELPWLKK